MAMYRNKRKFNLEVFSSELEKKLETLNIETQAVMRVNFNIVFDRLVDLIVQTVSSVYQNQIPLLLINPMILKQLNARKPKRQKRTTHRA